MFGANEAHDSAARRHLEVRVLALMERARPAKAVADALELYELTDDRDDVSLLAHLFDNAIGNHPSSATVTPAPPSFQAPSRNCFTRVSLLSISATRSRSAPVPFP